MTPYVKQSGVWRAAVGLSVKSGGIIRTVQKGFVRQSGVWRQFFQVAASFVLSSGAQGSYSATQNFTGLITSTLSINTDGVCAGGSNDGTSGHWGTPTTAGIGSSYWVRFNRDGAGVVTGGIALNTWYQITANRVLQLRNAGTSQDNTGTVTVDFSADGGSTIAATQSYGYEVGYTP